MLILRYNQLLEFNMQTSTYLLVEFVPFCGVEQAKVEIECLLGNMIPANFDAALLLKVDQVGIKYWIHSQINVKIEFTLQIVKK